jgi:hypothetical protein
MGTGGDMTDEMRADDPIDPVETGEAPDEERAVANDEGPEELDEPPAAEDDAEAEDEAEESESDRP